jgi:hypothetical protein
MKYYRELDIDCEEIRQAILKDYIPDEDPNFWNDIDNVHLDILTDIFKEINITPKYYSIINASTSNFNIHIDACPEPIRINIPLLNCEFSTTIFYKSWNNNQPKLILDNPIMGVRRHLQYDTKDLHIADMMKLKKATAIRVHEPHAVTVLKKHTPRLALTVGFEEDLEDILNEIL